MKLRNIECIIYTAEVLLISTTITKIVAQKRCSDIFNIDSLTEEIQLNWTVIINELTLNEDLYEIPGFSRYGKEFTNKFSLLLRDLAFFQPVC